MQTVPAAKVLRHFTQAVAVSALVKTVPNLDLDFVKNVVVEKEYLMPTVDFLNIFLIRFQSCFSKSLCNYLKVILQIFINTK